ncbi:DUF2812 domain-containing protein [uncultured Clostridium sp.]|uniref:DUF2812 domain-containing protein n=1 Tax=uncultured Clostridium sp. TaxID=59620 RepID=UPI0028F04B47|nr:DUF2812 domain-containing protein [uncultured Clostridium sp.]
MKKIIKLFWSFNIIKIEKWLSEKALEGYILKDVNMITRVFTFEKGEGKKLTYKICCEAKGTKDIQNALKKDGWYKVCNKGKWFFITNEKEKEEIKIYPSRERLLKRIKILKSILGFIALYYGVSFGIFSILFVPVIIAWIFGLGNIQYINEASEESIESGVSYFTNKDISGVVSVLAVISILSYLIFKLNTREKELKGNCTSNLIISDDNVILEEEEVSPKKGVKTIKKLKLGWMYSPDRLENWLEQMESRGFNLYKVNNLGTKFYFVEGKPRKIRYVTDYQNLENKACYEIYKQDGWKLIFNSMGSTTKWTIWGKEYVDERPEIYSDKSDMVKHAKKVLISYSIWLIPVIIMFMFQVKMQMTLVMKYGYKMWGFTLIPMIVLIYFCYLYYSVIVFYNRTKKQLII